MKPIKMSAARRLEELQSFVNLCFAMLEKYDNRAKVELVA